jgi:hypothetical protein
MTFTPRLGKLMLTAHITFSVGWLGAVAAFLALALAGLFSQDAQQVRGAYIAMGLSGWYVIVPASLAALLTGIVQGLGTRWGLLKHYWVLVKLILTALATVILLVHMQPVSYLAAVASKMTLSALELRGLRIQLVADAVAALVVLLFATGLSVYKPWGRTRFGLVTQPIGTGALPAMALKKTWERYVLIAVGIFVALFLITHLMGGGLHHQ